MRKIRSWGISAALCALLLLGAPRAGSGQDLKEAIDLGADGGTPQTT